MINCIKTHHLLRDTLSPLAIVDRYFVRKGCLTLSFLPVDAANGLKPETILFLLDIAPCSVVLLLLSSEEALPVDEDLFLGAVEDIFDAVS